MYKKLKINFMITIIAIIFLALIIPSINNESLAVSLGDTSDQVSGTYLNKSFEKTSWEKLEKKGYTYILSPFFKNNYTFCIALGQNISFGEGTSNDMLYYEIDKLTIDGSKDNYLNGLAYILCQRSERDTTTGWENYHNDPIQLALWMYLSAYDNNLPDEFPSQGDIKVVSEKYIQGKDSHGKTIGGNNDNGKAAYTIYNNANIAKGNSTKYYKADVNILTYKGDNKNKYQKLMLVKDTDESANLKIKINKIVDKGEPEKKFQFTVKFIQNDNSLIEGNSKTIQKYIGKDETKTFSYATDSRKDITVEITETSRDEDYTAAGKITIKYKYNSEENRWDLDTTDGDAMSGDISKLSSFEKEDGYVRYQDRKIRATADHKVFEIIVVNEQVKKPSIKLYFMKTDISGKNSLEDSEIKVEKANNSNIELIKYYVDNDGFTQRESLELTSQKSGYFRETAKDGKKIKITPTTNDGTIYLKITEAVAPNGYSLLNDGNPLKLKIDYDTSSGAITSISFTNTNYNRFLEYEKDEDGYTEIKIKNDPRIIKDLTIIKKDKSEDKSGKGAVEDAIFEVYFNNITYVKIDGKKYVVKDIIDKSSKIIKDGKEYYKKTANGLTFLVPTEETEEDYDNRLYIEGLKTDENGQIKIDEIEAIENKDIIYVKVTETGAPKGYDILPKSAKLLLKYNNRGSNKWELFLRDGSILEEDSKNYNKLDSEYYSLESGILTLTLIDDFKIDKLTILKTDSQNSSTKLPEAKFNITLTNVKSIGSYSSGNKSRENNIKKC